MRRLIMPFLIPILIGIPIVILIGIPVVLAGGWVVCPYVH